MKTSETGLLVLHTLRCGGHATLPRVAVTTGLDESDLEFELIELGRAGLVVGATGPFAGWGITEQGRAVDAEQITAALDAAGARDAVTAAYHRFLELNPELLDLCRAWQLRDVDGAVRVNDHTDPEYDERVLDRFTDLHHRGAAVTAELAAALPRFARYGERLSDALRRAHAGATEHLTTSVTSFHAVWAELHEDLLATLGIPR